MQMLDMISSQQGFKLGNLLLVEGSSGLKCGPPQSRRQVFSRPSIHVSFSAYKLLFYLVVQDGCLNSSRRSH